MSTTTEFVPLAVYLKSDEYEPAAEYVDGVIEERPMGEDSHAAMQLAICAWFLKHGNEWNTRVRPELRVQVAATRFRIPDVTVLDRSQPIEQVATRPPLAVFEVLSPEDTVQRLKSKLNDYQKMGIPEVWVVDPETREWSRFEDGQLVRRTEFQRGVMSFPLSAIEAEIDD